MADSGQQETMLKTAAGVAGGALLFSPVGMPIVHGIAGLAVASLGLIAAGSAVGAITDNIGNIVTPKDQHREEYPDFTDEKG
ncbi:MULTISPECIES: hypothetical protein [Prosthecochloris]|uniref:hypothetical protein n=1 Tax=Prosthecochloris TaxID=1101 RepID=UPI000D71B049|nr:MULTISPECIES: hypothetical protein [Prosthecochloris]UZJ36600.1 hypothetical protein OO005_07450 [Prosthecochloris sp. SCSIO W1103]UZJ40328.1 hypothetical protein OO006_08080 [Prosthecochloris sp. SCSIO W1101]